MPRKTGRPSNSSRLVDRLSALPPQQRKELLASLSDEEVLAFKYDWYGVWARDKQQIPPGLWRYWVIMTGRAWGKTRTGAEWVRHRVESGQARNVALVARTKGDIRDVLVEGRSGIMRVCPDAGISGKGPIYEPSKRRITWPNGAIATLYSADEPDQLRGPEHDTAWCDELAAWRRPEAFDNLDLGLRVLTAKNEQPQAIITTTPKRVALLRKILKMPGVVQTAGSTYENRENLAADFLTSIDAVYEGTRLGLQELHGVLLDDNPDALWRWDLIENKRVTRSREWVRSNMRRIVVAVDPEATNTEDSAETGIVVAGRGLDGHFYVLDDKTVKGTPHTWGRAVADAYREWDANLVVGEVNNGGDMIEFVIKQASHAGDSIAYKSVRASRGKLTRAEPISALYERGHAHHVGVFPELESQMTTFIPGEKSPDRMDALVWAGTELMLGLGLVALPAVGKPHILEAGYLYE